jgi:hypothetical protein
MMIVIMGEGQAESGRPSPPVVMMMMMMMMIGGRRESQIDLLYLL